MRAGPAKPYLVLPRNPTSTLYALTSNGVADFMLHLRDPSEEQELPTWRGYFDEYESIDIEDKEAVENWWREEVGDRVLSSATGRIEAYLRRGHRSRFACLQNRFNG